MRVGIALSILVASVALAQSAWPREAESRFEEATRLSQKGDYEKAATAYRDVADWPSGGEFPQRAQALFCAGLNEKNAQSYEKALATWRDLERRFPKSDYAKRAKDEIERLDPPGARGVDFTKRYEDAWAVLLPAIEQQQRGEDARPALEKALRMLEPLLADHRDHPQASDAALAISDARGRLGDLDGARVAAEDAVALARAAAIKKGSDPKTEGNVVNAELKLLDAKRAVIRRWLDRIAKTVLTLVLGVFVSVRPWRVSPRRLLGVARNLVILDAGLALAAVGFAEYVRRYIDDHSPLDDVPAALLVLVPGLVAITVSLGITNAVRGRRGAVLGAACGALAGAALAVSFCYAFNLFPYLDSEL